MSDTTKFAANCWEVERRSCGDFLRPYYMVVLRNKRKGTSVIKATSADSMSMSRYAEHLSDDLYKLTDDEFSEKYQLSSTS